MNVCKYKDEEECQKIRIFFPKNEYFIEYKRGFFIQSHPYLILTYCGYLWYFFLSKDGREMSG